MITMDDEQIKEHIEYLEKDSTATETDEIKLHRTYDLTRVNTKLLLDIKSTLNMPTEDKPICDCLYWKYLGEISLTGEDLYMCDNCHDLVIAASDKWNELFASEQNGRTLELKP